MRKEQKKKEEINEQKNTNNPSTNTDKTQERPVNSRILGISSKRWKFLFIEGNLGSFHGKNIKKRYNNDTTKNQTQTFINEKWHNKKIK